MGTVERVGECCHIHPPPPYKLNQHPSSTLLLSQATLNTPTPHTFNTYALLSTLIQHICVWLQLLDSAGVGGSDTAAAAAALREKNEISVMGLIGTGTFGKVWGKCGKCVWGGYVGEKRALCGEDGVCVGQVREKGGTSVTRLG